MFLQFGSAVRKGLYGFRLEFAAGLCQQFGVEPVQMLAAVIDAVNGKIPDDNAPPQFIIRRMFLQEILYCFKRVAVVSSAYLSDEQVHHFALVSQINMVTPVKFAVVMFYVHRSVLIKF